MIEKSLITREEFIEKVSERETYQALLKKMRSGVP